MLFLLMIALPFVELSLLLQVGERIGTEWTLLSVIATGLIGAKLAKSEGLKTLTSLQKEMQSGAMPGRLLVGGAVIFASGILLMTPGILTDALGFFGLVPWTRGWMVQRVFRWVESAVADGRFVVHQGGIHAPYQGPGAERFSQHTRREQVVIDQDFESPPSDSNNRPS